jgi:Ca2+-binding EF-hand superfamily protein
VRIRCFIIAVVIAVLFAGSAQAAGSQSGHSSQTQSLLRQMDTDRNGTVSRTEFLHFMGRRFNRLDVNRNGKLEIKELRPLTGGR